LGNIAKAAAIIVECVSLFLLRRLKKVENSSRAFSPIVRLENSKIGLEQNFRYFCIKPMHF
jgi:hypothetical protein